MNPVDVLMVGGYGREILGTWKRVADCDSKANRFPLTPGRDCAGIVEAVGGGVKGLAPGDEVIAVIPAIWQGSHAEYVLAGVLLLPQTIEPGLLASSRHAVCGQYSVGRASFRCQDEPKFETS